MSDSQQGCEPSIRLLLSASLHLQDCQTMKGRIHAVVEQVKQVQMLSSHTRVTRKYLNTAVIQVSSIKVERILPHVS